MKKVILLLILSIGLSLNLQSANQPVDKNKTITLEQIMADPDWMGNSPSDPIWSFDSQSVYFSQKAAGHSHKNDFRWFAKSNKQVQLNTNEDRLIKASLNSQFNQKGNYGVFEYQGDIYWVNKNDNTIHSVIKDEAKQSDAKFIGDSKIGFLQDSKIFTYDIDSKTLQQIASFELKKDPDEVESKSYLEQSQPRLFQVVAEKQKEDAYQKQRKLKQSVAVNKTWYLGENVDIGTLSLSSNGKWVLLGTLPKSLSGKNDHMPVFVTEDGYVEDQKVRSLVGTSKPVNETFYLVDLVKHKKYPVDLSKLPGINDDPLKELRKKAAVKIGYKYTEDDKPRAVYAHRWGSSDGVVWTDDGNTVAIQLFSYDNKDRWIVSLDGKTVKLSTQHWMTDPAWINDWTFNDFGWLPDNKTIYYLSEEDGYSHIYIKSGKRRATQLTRGEFEVSDITLSKDGKFFYFKANKNHPGNYEIYRIASKGGRIQALTELGGINDYALSHDEKSLAILHSKSTEPTELYIQPIDSKKSVKITNTTSERFKSYQWQAPEIVAVKSPHSKKPIYSRYYASRSDNKKDKNGKKPAVIFVHGAGYLQNAHKGWSGYFREFMFHNMLTQQGYVVLDMDYRASKGYGRDWRTAIYRNMGTPELEDLVQGAKWLAKNANVDPDRIGIYGGSYGGFMTFMAMFKEPDVFAAGAALRPVTDWVHYNHGYTSNILNTPQVDPDAFERSSPIEFAEGLKKPLLIAHGMVDDNVFFKDSVRLVQRLIELKKTRYFETAIYPVEPHGFREPSSWLDEYTRIYQLFEEHLSK